MTVRLARLLMAGALAATSAPCAFAAIDPLESFRRLTVPGGVASAATCIQHADPAMGGPTGGRLELDGLPQAATVLEAWLYWTVLSDTSPVPPGAPMMDGVPLEAVPVGEVDESPCFPQGHTGAFRADVTALVSGDGTYLLSGFLGDGIAESPADFTEGATLLVLYCAPGEPDRDLLILEGLDVTLEPMTPFVQELAGFIARDEEPVPATVVVVAGNGQGGQDGREEDPDPFVLGGVDLDAANPEILSGALCPPLGLYDHTRIDATGLINRGAESAVLEIRAMGDCHSIAAVALAIDTVPGRATPEPSALDRDPAATPLTVRRVAGLELRWQELPGPGADHVYRGTLDSLWTRDAYDHGAIGACGLATPAVEVPEEAGDHYFLAVRAGCGGADSTTGRDSLGRGRPSAETASGSPCP